MAEDYYVNPRTKKSPTATGGVQAGAGGGFDLQHSVANLLGTGEYRPGEHEALRSTLVGPSAEYEQRGYEGAFGDLERSRQVSQQQAELARALQMQAAGIGPSLAQMQLQQGMERSQAAAQSQLASARGLSPAQAQRMALQQQAGARANLAQQAGMLRLQEQAMKQQQLASLLGQQRGQDITSAGVGAEVGGSAGGRRLRAEESGMGQANREQDVTRQVAGGLLEGAGKAISLFAHGGALPHSSEVPGRAKYRGDTRSNDTVPAMLSPGEIVLPRSVAQDANAPDKARQFVAAIKKRQKTTPKDFSQALSRLRELEARLDAMESLNDVEAESEDD